MNVNGTARGGRLCSSSNCRRVPARMNQSPNRIRSVRFGRWTHGLQPLRVTGSECAQLPLVHAVATVKIDRGRQYKNTKSCRNLEIQSQARAVNGIAALVTTPLRLLVTSASTPFADLHQRITWADLEYGIWSVARARVLRPCAHWCLVPADECGRGLAMTSLVARCDPVQKNADIR